jgi:hypothetical protein
MIFAASQRANPRVGDAVQVGNQARFRHSNRAPHGAAMAAWLKWI